jgi:hypothetical protein
MRLRARSFVGSWEGYPLFSSPSVGWSSMPLPTLPSSLPYRLKRSALVPACVTLLLTLLPGSRNETLGTSFLLLYGQSSTILALRFSGLS